MSEGTIKERLSRIEQKVDDLTIQFSNHLLTHTKYTYLAFSTLIGMVVTLAVVIIRLS